MQEQSHILPFALSLVDHFAGNKHQYDSDDDSGMGPSTFSDTKSTTLSEVSYAPQSCSKLFEGAVAMVIKSCLRSLCMQLGWCGGMLHPYPIFFLLLRHSEIPTKAIFEAHFLILGKRKFDSYMIMIQIVHILPHTVDIYIYIGAWCLLAPTAEVFRLDSQNCFLPVFHGKQNLNSLDNHLEI